MCGIVGYTGLKEACTVIMEGLERLEYRGYDSAGISLHTPGGIDTLKAAGRLTNLAEKIAGYGGRQGAHCGIGHTRWATHGAATEVNAHPHGTPRISLVHNGIIENYRELREQLLQKGFRFCSETDTEVAAVLIDSLYDGDALRALAGAQALLEGSYAFAVLFADQPGRMYGIRKNSPLIVGVGQEENFLASDISALLPYTREYFELEEGEIAAVSMESAEVRSPKGLLVEKERKTAHWSAEQAQKGGFEHFMLKEIFEQPTALGDTLRPRIRDGLPDFGIDMLPEKAFAGVKRIYVVACGTAMHAGTLGKGVIEKLARIPVDVDLASEFRYRNPILEQDCLLIAISQSGETADTLAALRLAKEQGIPTLAIVNVPGSTLSREAAMVLYTHAGPEISVASTKAFSVQMGLLYLVAISLAMEAGRVERRQARALVGQLLEAVDAIQAELERREEIEALSIGIARAQNMFFMGRGLDYPLAMEGSLKLKEVSYIHSEAYAAGELKHGAISLVVEGTPIVALGCQQQLLAKTASNIKEVAARGADTLLLCKEGALGELDDCGSVFPLPDLDDLFMPFPCTVALQLLAYYVAVDRGCDVDKPRNLAKSVTVE